ncbi:MAG: amidohydrolase [Flavobacterium sp. JAD_PAG50586_2]|nr:MAG: amidohydrolase [Flavobacterium sp. JAD_PAG50586_2]
MDFKKEQLAFIEKAMQSISDDPQTRLSQVAKDVIAENNYVFDAHCHLFDGDCINVKYMATRMIAGAVGRFKEWVWRLVTGKPYTSDESLLSTKQMVEMVYENPMIIQDKDLPSALDRMEKELDQMEIEAKTIESIHSFGLIEFIKRYRTIIRLLRSGSMKSVYNTFEQNYAIHQVLNYREGGNKKLLTVALGMDLNSGWEGSVPKTWEEQNTELAFLSKSQPVLPYLPVDPRRENLYEEFLKAFDQRNPQFFGVKCYPALGYLPADERLMPIFKICEQKNIPVMTHCGGESVSTFESPIHVNRLGEKIEINDLKRKHRARKLNEPKEWEYVLEEYKDLRLCLGHYGGSSAWENDPDTAHRIPEILDMMDRYDNLYADFSFNLKSLTAIKNFRNKLFTDDAQGNLMKERSLFGTDFWVILPISDLITDQHNFVVETEGLLNELLKINVLKYMKLT